MKLSSQASTASVTTSGNTTTRPASQVAMMDSKPRLITGRGREAGGRTGTLPRGRADRDASGRAIVPRDGRSGSMTGGRSRRRHAMPAATSQPVVEREAGPDRGLLPVVVDHA